NGRTLSSDGPSEGRRARRGDPQGREHEEPSRGRTSLPMPHPRSVRGHNPTDGSVIEGRAGGRTWLQASRRPRLVTPPAHRTTRPNDGVLAARGDTERHIWRPSGLAPDYPTRSDESYLVGLQRPGWIVARGSGLAWRIHPTLPRQLVPAS